MIAAAAAFALLVIRDNQVGKSVRESAVWGAYQLETSKNLAVAVGM